LDDLFNLSSWKGCAVKLKDRWYVLF